MAVYLHALDQNLKEVWVSREVILCIWAFEQVSCAAQGHHSYLQTLTNRPFQPLCSSHAGAGHVMPLNGQPEIRPQQVIDNIVYVIPYGRKMILFTLVV